MKRLNVFIVGRTKKGNYRKVTKTEAKGGQNYFNKRSICAEFSPLPLPVLGKNATLLLVYGGHRPSGGFVCF